MKDILLPALILATFILIVPPASGEVNSFDKAFMVDSGDEFTWKLTFDNKIQSKSVDVPEGFPSPDKKVFDKKVSLTFDTEGVEEGVYRIDVTCVFLPDYSKKTYSAFVIVGIPTEKSVENLQSDVEHGFGVVINRTESLEKNLSQLEVRQTVLKEKIKNLTQQLNNSQKKIERLENRLEQQNQSKEGETGITSTFLERGSILLGLTILIVLVVYLAYEKFQEKEKEEEIEVEEKPRDFSPE